MEAPSVIWAVRQLISLGIKEIILEYDCIDVVRAFNSNEEVLRVAEILARVEITRG